MTAPGSVTPASPGWWVRTSRCGINTTLVHGWNLSATGGTISKGHATAAYGWTIAATGLKPVVTFDAVGGSDYATGTINWSHTAAPGAYVLVAVSAYYVGAVTGATYDGAAMTLLGTKYRSDNSTYGATAVYGITDATGGTKTITVTRTGAYAMFGTSVSYLRVGSVLGISPEFGSGVTLSQASSPFMTVECEAVQVFGSSNALTPSGGTSRFNGGSTGAYLSMLDSTAATTFTATQTAAYWSGITLVLRPYLPPPLYILGLNKTFTNSVTLPLHQAGDLIQLFVYRSDNNVLPTKPAASGSVPAWVDDNAATGANTNSLRLAHFVATGQHTSGTWTNASAIVAVTLRGQNATPIGGHAEAGSASTSGATAPAVTMSTPDGTSKLLHFYGRRPAVTTWSATPNGYTTITKTDPTGSLPGICLDFKNSTTSDGSATHQTGTTSSLGYRGATIEIQD